MNLQLPITLMASGFLISLLVGALLALVAVWLARPVTTNLRARRLLRAVGFGRNWKPTLLRTSPGAPEQDS